MIARNCTMGDMERALDSINDKYQGNVEWKTLTQKGKNIDFTLKVRDSHKPGHRRGFQGQRSVAACWHVHGDFFDALIKLNPQAEIVSRSVSTVINRFGGNWQDKNIGSMMNPLLFSEACDCGKGDD